MRSGECYLMIESLIMDEIKTVAYCDKLMAKLESRVGSGYVLVKPVEDTLL